MMPGVLFLLCGLKKCRDLEADYCPNRKPEQFVKDWLDVVATMCTCHYPCKEIFNKLQLVKIRFGHAGQKHIAIVQSGTNDGLGHSICILMVHSPLYMSKTLYMKVHGLADVSCVLFEH